MDANYEMCMTGIATHNNTVKEARSCLRGRSLVEYAVILAGEAIMHMHGYGI
jgi:hypothetical protein